MFSTGDVYDMPGYPDLPREAHKKFINTIINAETIDAAARSISTATMYYNIQKDCWVINTYSGAQRRVGDPVFQDKPMLGALGYVYDFLLHHPQFTRAAAENMWGILHLLESTIIEDVVRRLTMAGVPCLPVHDEIIVPESRQAQAMDYLSAAYRHCLKQAGSYGSISVKWTSLGGSKLLQIDL